MSEKNNHGANLPLEAPICGSAAFWSLVRLNEKPAVPPDLVLSQIEYIRTESEFDAAMGFFQEGRLVREASVDQIAELNGFLARALQTVGITQES